LKTNTNNLFLHFTVILATCRKEIRAACNTTNHVTSIT